MWDALDITPEQAAGLDELAANDLDMAREFSRRAKAAEDSDEANDLARSYQRMARSYRQTLSLKVRLKRELLRAARENQGPPGPVDEERILQRKLDILEPVQKILWAVHQEREAPEREIETFCEDLDHLDEVLADRAERDPRFGEAPLEDDIVSVCAELGISEIVARARATLDQPPGRHFPDWIAALQARARQDTS